MGLVNNLRPDKRSLFDNLFTTSELILQLKDQGNLCSRYLTSRGCEIPTEKEMRKSSYRAINQFTEKSGLVFYVWFDYCQVITISNSLVRVLFLMQSDMLLRQKKKIVLIPRPATVEIYNRFMGVSSKQICNTTIKHNWVVENGTIVLLFTWIHLPL